MHLKPRRSWPPRLGSFGPVKRFRDSPHAPLLHALVRDPWNRVRYGAHAPRFAERLWIDPREVRHFARKGVEWRSGQVAAGAWSMDDARPIEDDPVMHASIIRWVDGRPWEETGELERMEMAIARLGEHTGCRNRADVLRRCARLDEIFRTMECEGRVRTQSEVEPGVFREFGGIGMHLGFDGTLVRAGNGRHRFAMAWILAVPRIPVRVGIVHASALPYLEELRREPQTV